MEAVKSAIENKIPVMFDYLDKEIGNKQYLVDGHFSLADISMVTAFLNFAFAGHSIDEKQWKNLSRYINSLFYQKNVHTVFQRAESKWVAINAKT